MFIHALSAIGAWNILGIILFLSVIAIAVWGMAGKTEVKIRPLTVEERSEFYTKKKRLL